MFGGIHGPPGILVSIVQREHVCCFKIFFLDFDLLKIINKYFLWFWLEFFIFY